MPIIRSSWQGHSLRERRRFLAQNWRQFSPFGSVLRANGLIRQIKVYRGACFTHPREVTSAHFGARSLTLGRNKTKTRVLKARSSSSGRTEKNIYMDKQCLRLKSYSPTQTQSAYTDIAQRVGESSDAVEPEVTYPGIFSREIRRRTAKVGNSEQECFHSYKKWSGHPPMLT